jgi:hypothetical protein
VTVNAKGKEPKPVATVEPITRDWLTSIGILQSDAGKSHPNDTATEYGCRIRGGDDDGWKTSSDDDKNEDEIAELNIVFEKDGSVYAYVETYTQPRKGGTHCETVSMVELGQRHTRGEILELCRALKAWAITYPKEPELAANE